MTRAVHGMVALCLLTVPSLALPAGPDSLDALMRQLRVTPLGTGLAPAFSLRTANGQPVILAEFRDRAVMLCFWATW